MAKRDPNKTARNKRVAELKLQRRKLFPKVRKELLAFEEGRYDSESSLNAFIGSKTAEYIDLKDAVIKTPEEYISLWVKGLKEAYKESIKTGRDPRHQRIYRLLTVGNRSLRKYFLLLLEGSFLKHYDEHYKTKPKIAESEFWFGNNNDEFGLLVTPRFKAGQWENDKSEVRHFSNPYWTIAHVLDTGLVYMGEEKKRTFTDIDAYLQFFRDIARRTKSKYQLEIADKYIEYVKEHEKPKEVPLLIPELRYDPFKQKHLHRLDFLIINPWTMQKFGIEISPWSSHGRLEGANKKLSELNAEAKNSFQKEMRKHKRYWRKYGVSYITYTDDDLEDIDEVWSEIRSHLEMEEKPDQFEISFLESLRAS